MNTHDTDQTNQVRHKVRKEKKMLNYRYLVRHFYILSPSVRLVFGSTFGVWWGLGFAAWRDRALGGIRGPPGVGLRWVAGFSFFLGLGGAFKNQL